MSMTYTLASDYVSRALARAGDTDRTATAQDAIKAAIGEWNIRRDWNFLLMDTRNGFSVTGCSCSASASGTVTMSATGSATFAGINVGNTFTGPGSAVGSVAALVSDTSFTATVTVLTATATGTMTFSGDIPVISGTDEYNFPTDIKRVHSARLIDASPRPLAFKAQREWDRLVYNQANGGVPRWYNNFNDATFTTNRQYGKIRLMPIPTSADILRVRYYRSIAEPSQSSDLLDLPDRYVYAILTLARFYFLLTFNAETVRLEKLEQRAEFLLGRAIRDDRVQTYDKDLVALPYVEWGGYDNPYFDNSGAYY